MENLDKYNLQKLFNLKKKFFLIWEDRKLCDIGNTNHLIIKKLLSYPFLIN